MISPPFRVNSGTAELTFRNRYDLETTFLRNKLYDGSVLEIKISDGFFQDIVQAGGIFTSGGYDGVIDSCCQNPLAGRLGWSGKAVRIKRRNLSCQPLNFRVARQEKMFDFAGASAPTTELRVKVSILTTLKFPTVSSVRVSVRRTSRAPFDFDGDGKTDFSVFRPSDNQNAPDFYVQNSSNNAVSRCGLGKRRRFGGQRRLRRRRANRLRRISPFDRNVVRSAKLEQFDFSR